MKKIFNNVLFYYCLFIFFFFFVISILMPYGGDDWYNLVTGSSSNLDTIINNAILNYNTWEGRFFSRICLGLFVPHQFIWSLLNASIMTFMFYVFNKFIKPKNILITSLLVLCLLFVDFQTFSQVYVWKTGNITYLFPMFYASLLLFVRLKLLNGEDKKDKWYSYILLPILALPFCMFVETASILIIAICLFFIIYNFIKNNKIDVLMLLCFIFGLIGFLLMIFSPGTLTRLNETSEFASLSIIGKFIYNLPNLIKYTYIKNSFLIILMVIVLIKVIKIFISNKYFRIFLYLFVTLIPLCTSVVNVVTFILNDSIRYFWRLLDPNLWYIMLYWIIFTFVVLYFILKYILKEKNIKLLALLIFAIIGNGSMMISPIWGGRTAFVTTVFLFLLLLSILNDNIKFKKVYFIISNIIICAFALGFITYSVWCHNLYTFKDKYIDYQMKNNASKLDVIILPSYYTWNLTPYGEGGSVSMYKSYKRIDENIKFNLIEYEDVPEKIKKEVLEK